MLTNSDLAYMRDAIEQLLPDVCNILTVTNAPNGQGGVTETIGTASANIACRLDMSGGREPTQGGAVQQFTSYMLSIPYNTTIDFTNRVEIDSVVYAVTSINDGQSWAAVKRVTLEVI
jgi:hypothetical protein